MRQARGGEVPERLERVNPDVRQDKCQGLTPKKKVCKETYLPFFCFAQCGWSQFQRMGMDERRGTS